MPSAIQDELTAAVLAIPEGTEIPGKAGQTVTQPYFVWSDDKSAGDNVRALITATDPLDDDAFTKLTPEARGFIDAVVDAIEAKGDIPNFPDYVEPEPEPEPAPAPRRRRAAAAAETETEAQAAPEPAPRRRTAASTSGKAPAKPRTPSKPADPEVEGEAAKPKRGDRMSFARILVLENPTMSRSEIEEACLAEGYSITGHTAALVRYATLHTLAKLKELGLYDHEKALAARAGGDASDA